LASFVDLESFYELNGAKWMDQVIIEFWSCGWT